MSSDGSNRALPPPPKPNMTANYTTATSRVLEEDSKVEGGLELDSDGEGGILLKILCRLSEVDLRTLLRSQEVSRRWKNTIDGSCRLQTALFQRSLAGPIELLRIDHRSNDGRFSRENNTSITVVKNSLLGPLWSLIDRRILAQDIADAFPEPWDRPQASWRRMRLIHPPVHLSIEVDDSPAGIPRSEDGQWDAYAASGQEFDSGEWDAERVIEFLKMFTTKSPKGATFAIWLNLESNLEASSAEDARGCGQLYEIARDLRPLLPSNDDWVEYEPAYPWHGFEYDFSDEEGGPGSASAEVFGVPELLEMILKNLIPDSPGTVLRGQAVCKTWLTVIQSSTALQRMLFFSPTPVVDGMSSAVDEAFAVTENPLLTPLLRAMGIETPAPLPQNFFGHLHPHWGCAGASWRKMYLTQPSIKVDVETTNTPPQRKDRRKRVVRHIGGGKGMGPPMIGQRSSRSRIVTGRYNMGEVVQLSELARTKKPGHMTSTTFFVVGAMGRRSFRTL